MGASRRDLLRLALLSSTFLTAGGHLANARVRVAAPTGYDPVRKFPQGVASADPTPDGVLLWARTEPVAPDRDVPLFAQVAERPDFSRLIIEEAVTARGDADHTVRAVVNGLRPDRQYYYRFVTAQGEPSQLGRTRTAPAPDARRPFRLATASCQNFQTGYYHAYRMLLEREQRDGQAIDFVLFLGDFIYELIFRGGVRPLTLPRRDWTSSDGISGTALNYQFAQTTDDYRYLYRAYLSDPWLRAARAQWPFLCIWDDHEFSNDSWQSMATYDEAGTPSQRRRVAASQAWFEYVPARLTGPLAHDFKTVQVSDATFDSSSVDEPNNRAAIDAIALPRRLQWGALADVVLTDSRSYRSAPVVPPAAAKEVSLHPRALLPRSLVEAFDTKTPGTMWGSKQKQWVKQQWRDSAAVWKLCASSVPVMPLGFGFRFDRKTRDTVRDDVVFSIDSWEGYPSERRELLDFIAEQGVQNVVFLSGDHHMHFAGVLETDGEHGKVAAAEFCVAGVSSTSLGDVLKGFTDGEMKGTLAAKLIGGPDVPPGSRWVNASFMYDGDDIRRWLEAVESGKPPRAPARRCHEHLRFIDARSYGLATIHVEPQHMTVTYDTYGPEQIGASYDVLQRPAYRVALRLKRGGMAEMLKASPEFEGTPPFPFA